MTTAQRKAFYRDLGFRVAMVFAALGFLATLGLQVFLAFQDHHRIEQNNEIQQFIKAQALRNHAISEQIRSCTTPTGACYKRGQAQTGAAVAGINDFTEAAVWCAQNAAPATERAMHVCILSHLSAGQ